VGTNSRCKIESRGFATTAVLTLALGIGASTAVFTVVDSSLLAGRVIQKLLYGIQAVDPSVMFIVATLFLIAAVTAAFLSARRAALVDPMEALRSE
jgi:ABC-type antimicrobial peptide transport system permease subunit